jgi:hypothetical protein
MKLVMVDLLLCTKAMMTYFIIAFAFAFFLFTQPLSAQTTSEAVSVPQENSTTQETEATLPAGVSIEGLSSPSDEIPGDFVVGPGRTELTLSPGESGTVELIVSNRTGVDKEFRFEIEDVTGSRDGSNALVLLGADTGPYTLKNYIQLPFTKLDLKHNQRARIPVTISIPADAEPGGRYGTILVTTVTKDAIKNAPAGTAPASVIISRLGSHFFVRIPGDTYIDGQLQSIKTVPDKKFFSEGPIQFQLLFQNKGNLHLSPYGEIRIKNMLGEEVGFVELDPWFALPQSLRSREVEWNRELLVGRYTATAQINRGYDDIVDTETVTFWILPWKIVGGVFGTLFLLFVALRFIVKNFEFKRKGQ